MSFEKKLKKLEKIAEELEQGDIGLEELTERYAEGMNLIAELRDLLNHAEQKITEIGKQNSVE